MPQTKLSQTASIIQADQAKRVVVAIVQEPEVPTLNGHIYSAEVIQTAAWEFLARYGTVGYMHRDFDGNGEVVESWVAPADMVINQRMVPKGSWVIAMRISPERFQEVLDGKITGVSLGGVAQYEGDSQ